MYKDPEDIRDCPLTIATCYINKKKCGNPVNTKYEKKEVSL